jgi:hypothetical protein
MNPGHVSFLKSAQVSIAALAMLLPKPYAGVRFICLLMEVKTGPGLTRAVGQVTLRSRRFLDLGFVAASGIKKPSLERTAGLVRNRLIQRGLAGR